MITFSIINTLVAVVCITQAVFLLPTSFWFKDFLTLSKCRDNKLDDHGLEYDPMEEGIGNRHLEHLLFVNLNPAYNRQYVFRQK